MGERQNGRGRTAVEAQAAMAVEDKTRLTASACGEFSSASSVERVEAVRNTRNAGDPDDDQVAFEGTPMSRNRLGRKTGGPGVADGGAAHLLDGDRLVVL